MAPWVAGRDWVDGDDITEQRLDEQQGNADHLRDESRAQMVAQCDRLEAGVGSGFDAYWGRLRLVVNGATTYETDWSENPRTGFPADFGVPLPRNQALASLTAGNDYVIDIYLDLDTAIAMGSVQSFLVGQATFFYTEDMGFLSAFADLTWRNFDDARADSFTVLITRDDEAL